MIIIKRLITIIFSFLALFSANLKAQAIICPTVNAQVTTGASTTICQGKCAVLTATIPPINETTNYSVGSIPFAPQSTVGATSVVLSDDSQAGPLPIGFNFCFFGNTYNQFYLGSNGWISFSAGQTNAFTSATIPSTAFNVPQNCIMGPWQDWHPGSGIGPYISYRTIGTAPCRALVVTWFNCPMFSCTTTYGTFQIIIYETTNYIENHLTNKPNCTTWAGGTAVQGIHNLGGTIGITVPGRNSTQWTAVNEGWRWTPTGAPTYTINWVGPSGPIATGTQVTVCPLTTGVYTANATLGGCVGSSTISHTTQVVVSPGPTITANSASVCVGSGTTMTASGANTYTWQPGNIIGSSVSFTPASTTVYTVTGTSASGCTGSVTTTITVNPLPVVTPTANTPICAGGSLNLSVGSAASYTWSGPNAFSSSAQSPTIVNVTPVNSGNYSVSVTSTAGCKATNSIAVVVNPTVVLTPGNFGPYCVGSVINLTVAAATSYTWSGPNSFASNIQNPAIANSQTIHAGTYTVSTTSAAGCKSTGTTNVIVNPKPTPTITSNSPLCQGSTLNLSVTPTAASYTWAGPNSFASNAQNPTVANVTTLSAGNYTVTMTSTAGCTGSAVANVVVNPTPTLTASNTGLYCPGATISLSVTTATSYTWSGPSAFTSNAQTPTIANSTTLNSGNYTVAISSAAGCTNTAITNVVVNPASTPTATSNSPVCVGKTITFTGLGGTTYTWTGPSGFTSNAQNPSITTSSVANAGNYTLSVTNANGCTNSVVINVVINPLPVIAVNNPTTCVGSTFTLTATGGTAYVWSGPSSFNSALQNPPFSNATTAMSGNYTVIVTSAQGCTNNAVANASVVSSPTVSIVGTKTLCSQNFNTSINTTTLTANGGNNYSWTLPSGFSGSPNLNTSPITITPSVTSVQTVANVTVVGTVGTCTNSAVYSLTIIPNPTITVTSGSICAGKTLTLTSSGASTYTWSPSASLNTPNGSSVIANPAVTTVYSVIGSSVGCNSQTQTGTATVVINPTVTIAPNPALICLGSSINLTASGATSYTWSPSTALTTTNAASTTANPTITTTYSVLGSQATCTNLATVQVSVIGLPTVSIAGTTTLCSQNFNGSNNTTTLTASGAGTYVWTLPAGYTGSPNLSTNPITITGPVTALQTVATITVLGTAGSCTSQAVYNITVVPNPTIAVTSGSMCAGTSVTLTSSGASTYTWSPSASLNTPNGSSVIANPAVTTVYSVIGSSVGCNSQTQTGTASVVPNPTVTIAPGAPLICLGSSINLSASGATTYTWSPSTALTTTNAASTTANPTVTTTYSVLGSQATCTNLATVQVSVIGLPTVSIAGTTTLCSQNFNGSNNTTTLTASGAGTYVWTLPAGYTGSPNLSTNPITITGPVTALQTVATITVLGTAGTCTNQAVYTITVVPNPTIAVSSGSMCAGTSVTLTSSGASTFTWSPSASLNTPNGSSVIANPAVTTVYSVIGSSVGCNSQTQTGTANVVINPTVTINPNPALICLGSSINLSASGATTYTWSPNTALTSTNSANTTASPTITTTYSVLGSQATCTNLATVQVSVIGLPTVSIAGTTTLCSQNFNGSNNTTNLTASGAGTYVWTLPAGFSGSPNLTTNPVTITGPVTSLQTVATVTVLGTAGTCTNQAVYTITVVPNPTIAVTSGSMCAGTSVTLTSSGASTYTWSPSASLNTPNGSSVIANPAVTTVYSVIGSSVGCNSQTQSGTASVVPNPTVTFAPLTPTICLGNSINLTASGATNYTWSPNTAITTTTGANVTVNPTVTTSYTLIGEQATCTHVAVGTVSVISLPIVNVTPSSSTLCMNNFNGSPNTVSLTATGATSYTWGPIVGLTTNTLNGSTIIGTSDGLTAIGSGTVIGMVGTCSNVATFTVNSIPNPTIAVTSGSMCAGTSVTLISSGASTYTWSPSASLNTPNGSSVIASPAVTTVYSVIGGSVGCNSQTQTGIATVVANPTVNITPLTPTICIGTSINLTANGATNYTWMPNTAITTTTGANVTVNPTVTTTYSIIGEAATCTNSAVRTVTVVNLPLISIALNSPNICMNNYNGSNNLVNVTASGATSYNWVGFTGLAPNTLSGANVNASAIPPSVIGSGTVIGTANTCSNLATFSLAIIPNPIISATSASMCAGTSATLIANGALTYTWSPTSNLNTPIGS